MSAGRRPRIGFKNWLKGQQINPAKVSPEELAAWKRSYEDAMARAAAGPDVDDLKHEYFRTALEYYISARFAAVSGFNPMAGVLFHHAIELYLKGLLCRFVDKQGRKHLRHDLPRAWAEHKTVASDPTLLRFDDLVISLHRYWGVRYPDDSLETGIR